MRATLLLTLLLLAAPHAARAAERALVRGPYLQSLTPHSVVVRFRTGAALRGAIRVSGPDGFAHEAADPTACTDHELRVDGLSPASRYRYEILADGARIAGGDDAHAFTTAPPGGRPTPTRLWVIGDSGTANGDARAVRDAFLRFTGARAPDLWLMLGDNAYEAGTDEQYQHAVFENMYEALLRGVVLWPTLGNHDARSADSASQSGAYFDIFTLPTAGEAGGAPSGTEAYYAFDHGDAHFVCLDSADSDRRPGSPMLRWLEADLAATSARWIIAFWHHPPYTKGSHDSDYEADLTEMRRHVVPLLERGGVDLALTGHSHSYERSHLLRGHFGPSWTLDGDAILDDGDGDPAGDGAYLVDPARGGAVYVVAGSSGKVSGGSLDHPVMFASFNLLGSLVIDVDDDQLDARFLTARGEVKDHFALVKDRPRALPIVHQPIAPRDAWRRHVGAPPDPSWTTADFDDSGWEEGPAPIGFGEPFVATELDPGSTRPGGLWVRRQFDLAHAAEAVESARLRVLYDDGFVAWVNGVEVARAGLARGAVAPGAPATATEARRYHLFSLEAARGVLRARGNVLAIRVHDAGSQSSDLVIDAALEYDTRAHVPSAGR